MNNNTVIISGFPGVGKTYLYNMCDNESNWSIIDSDSSKFSWIIVDGEKKRNPEFPENYKKHIIENLGKVDIICVSTHKDVIGMMDNVLDYAKDNNINVDYYIVYPEKHLKEEYRNRYIKRNSPESFINLIMNNWDNFIDDLDNADLRNDYKDVKILTPNTTLYNILYSSQVIE